MFVELMPLLAADLAGGPPELQCPRERPAGLERGFRQFDWPGSIRDTSRFTSTRPLLDHRNLPGALGPKVLSCPGSPARKRDSNTSGVVALRSHGGRKKVASA